MYHSEMDRIRKYVTIFCKAVDADLEALDSEHEQLRPMLMLV